MHHRSVNVVVLPVVRRLGAISRTGALIMRSWVVRLVVVCIVMRLGVERVIGVVMLWSWVVIVVIVASGVWDILY